MTKEGILAVFSAMLILVLVAPVFQPVSAQVPALTAQAEVFSGGTFILINPSLGLVVGNVLVIEGIHVREAEVEVAPNDFELMDFDEVIVYTWPADTNANGLPDAGETAPYAVFVTQAPVATILGNVFSYLGTSVLTVPSGVIAVTRSGSQVTITTSSALGPLPAGSLTVSAIPDTNIEFTLVFSNPGNGWVLKTRIEQFQAVVVGTSVPAFLVVEAEIFITSP